MINLLSINFKDENKKRQEQDSYNKGTVHNKVSYLEKGALEETDKEVEVQHECRQRADVQGRGGQYPSECRRVEQVWHGGHPRLHHSV